MFQPIWDKLIFNHLQFQRGGGFERLDASIRKLLQVITGIVLYIVNTDFSFLGRALAVSSGHLCSLWVCSVSNHPEYLDGVISKPAKM